jgi:hypothetical protein
MEAPKVVAVYSPARKLIRYEYNGKAITTQEAIKLIMQRVSFTSRRASPKEMAQIGADYQYPEPISNETMEGLGMGGF